MKRKVQYQPPRRKNPTVNKQMTVEVNNQKLNQLLAAYKAEGTTDNLGALLNHLMKCRVLVPANLNEEKKPVPCLLKNKDDTLYFPIYSDKGQIPANMKSQAIMNMPFTAVNRTAVQAKELSGLVVNPFSTNLLFKPPLLQKMAEAAEQNQEIKLDEPVKKEVHLTEDQYLQLERHQYDAVYLPQQLFTQGQTFMDTLMEEREEYIDRLYEDSFKEKRMYPYLPEDFSVMVMDISEEMCMVRVDMPERDMAPGLAARVYCVWNPVAQKGAYYLICAGTKRGEWILNEITTDLKPKSYGQAPDVGAELQTVIDMAKENLSTESKA